MKEAKFFLFVGAVLFCLSVIGCKKNPGEIADENLIKAVENLTLPKTLSDGSTLTECSYGNKTLTFVCNVDKNKFKKLDSEKSKTHTIEQLKTSILPQNLVKKVSEANASIRYVFVYDKDTITYAITPADLKE